MDIETAKTEIQTQLPADVVAEDLNLKVEVVSLQDSDKIEMRVLGSYPNKAPWHRNLVIRRRDCPLAPRLLGQVVARQLQAVSPPLQAKPSSDVPEEKEKNPPAASSVASEKAASEKAAAEKAAAEKAASEKAPTETPTEKAPTEKAPTEKAPTEKAPTEAKPFLRSVSAAFGAGLDVGLFPIIPMATLSARLGLSMPWGFQLGFATDGSIAVPLKVGEAQAIFSRFRGKIAGGWSLYSEMGTFTPRIAVFAGTGIAFGQELDRPQVALLPQVGLSASLEYLFPFGVYGEVGVDVPFIGMRLLTDKDHQDIFLFAPFLRVGYQFPNF